MQKTSIPDVLSASGWSRSVAGAGPYLTLFARNRSSRAATDRAVAAQHIHELPAARGCTYIVPACDYALGLTLGDSFAQAPVRVAASLGVTDKEIAKLCDAVLRVVAATPMSPDDIRDAVGTASRSLGEAGKKKGMTTTLPLALGLLQNEGRIRRVPVNGRLDQQRYHYVRWTPSPRDGGSLSESDALTALARRYFRWVGPATMKEFQWFSGASGKAATAAVAALGLTPMSAGSDRVLLPEDVAAFAKFVTPKTPQYALVSSLDTMFAARREHRLLLDDADAVQRVVGDRKLAEVGSLAEVPSHAILDRGRLIGLWEYEVSTQRIVAALFGAKFTPALKAAIAETESFVRDDLGDARSFSLDSPASRQPRIDRLRAM